MMKSILVLLTALTMLSANAQSKKSDSAMPRLPQPMMKSVKPQAQVQEMQMRTPGASALYAAPKKASDARVWYRRPAGAFPASLIVEDGVYSGSLYSPYIQVKPYQDYTFLGFAEGVSDQANFEWDYLFRDLADDPDDDQQLTTTVSGQNLTWRWGYEMAEVPTLYVIEPDNTIYYWWHPGVSDSDASSWGQDVRKSKILSMPSTMDVWGMDFLKSSKTMVPKPGSYYFFAYYSCPDPYPGNEKGWWFGKNGYHYKTDPQFFVDGIAQAFEKPTSPYLLKQVVLDCAVLQVTAEVDMTCKIYKLDEIPAYEDNGSATLPEVPGELIAWGRATLTPETNAMTGGLVFFNLYDEEDGLEIDVTPTIDDAILIVIDGYNDPEMANLQDFTAMIASNIEDDEGYGELAYLKFGSPDGNGGVNYVWTGLNNFFSNKTMKTGFSIFINTELPYLTFKIDEEDGVFTFPTEGGLMEKHFGDYATRSIEFLSSMPSADDAWYVSLNNGDELPDWLTIELSDIEQNGAFTGLVNAEVVAEPLPEGVYHREAIVRSEIPGDYLEYMFMQGEIGPFPPPPCDGPIMDGELNIADIDYLIFLIIEGMYDSCYDVNLDYELTVADVNVIIDAILR